MADVAIPLISAGAGLIGAVIGSGTTLYAQWRQREAAQTGEVEKEAREAARKETEAKEERSRQALEACDALLFQIARLARHFSHPDQRRSEYSKRAEPLLAELSSHSVFLPDILLVRVDEAAKILAVADELALNTVGELQQQFHYQTLGSIAESTQQDVHLALAAWLQDRPLPSRSAEMRENLAAYGDYTAFMDDLFSDRDGDWYEEVKREFLRVHSELSRPGETSASTPDA